MSENNTKEMIKCPSCGSYNPEGSIFCSHCGRNLKVDTTTGYQANDIDRKYNGTMNGIETAAFVFMVLSTIVSGFLLLPLCWCIPMCIHYHSHPKTSSIGFKICTLLFVSLIGGILALCDVDK